MLLLHSDVPLSSTKSIKEMRVMVVYCCTHACTYVLACTHTHTHGCRAWLNSAYHGQRKWQLCYLWQQMTELSRQLFSLGTSTEFATCDFLQCLPEQPHPAFTHVTGKARVLSAPLWTCHSNLDSPSKAQFCQELGKKNWEYWRLVWSLHYWRIRSSRPGSAMLWIQD